MRNLLFLLTLTFVSCATKSQYNDNVPAHDNFKIESKILKETRVINVWKPLDYDSKTAYPVLYMPDGGEKEDFPHIANTIAKLIKAKKIPPMILVGIENTDRHRDLSGFSSVKADEQYCPLTDGARNFRVFITNELVQEIDKRYKTTNKKGIVGESLAGLFVVETFLVKPNTFDFYIAMDPSLWWNDHYLVKNAPNYLKDFPDKKIKLWFAGSSAEDIGVYTNSLNKILLDDAPKNLIWKYEDEPKEKHNTIFRATKEKAFEWILNE